MVYLIPAERCACGACSGGRRAPKGFFGGSSCTCRCHSLRGAERNAFVAAKDARLREEVLRLMRGDQPVAPPPVEEA